MNDSIAVTGIAKNAFDLLRLMGLLKNGEGVIFHGRQTIEGKRTILRIEFLKKKYPNDNEHLVEPFEVNNEEKAAVGYVNWDRGYQWGTLSPGAELLAYALLFDATGDAEKALGYRTEFMKRFLFNWGTDWGINAEQIRQWVAMKEDCARNQERAHD
jgi:hypothetical protein